MLNLQILYLQGTLQRLAEKVVAPGSTSELHTECLLTSVALEMRRKFLGNRNDDEDTSKLGPRQLNLLREIRRSG
ncbi:hypothetical protein NG726_17835 [Pseudomonas sp. MOB-449]|nr:hypothetical protein [Pseudomonas sp. MOB-449]